MGSLEDYEIGELLVTVDEFGRGVCGRCHRPVGDGNQGHYWAYCRVTQTTREFHFCCPNGCALEKDKKKDGR